MEWSVRIHHVSVLAAERRVHRGHVPPGRGGLQQRRAGAGEHAGDRADVVERAAKLDAAGACGGVSRRDERETRS